MLRETHIVEPKNGRGVVSEKVYCLYNHENVDIFGWPLTDMNTLLNVEWCLLLES